MSTSPSAGGNSNAYNFLSFLQSGVDPRTGSYSCRIALSELTSNLLSGPTLPLALSFDPLIRANSGFGRGWSIGISGYNESSRKLSLSTGATYEAVLSRQAFVLLDNKVDDLKATRRGNELLIEHKTGMLEVLRQAGAGSRDWLMSALYSPQGQALYFKYALHGGTRYLSQIRDETRALVDIQLAGSSPTITLWPDSPDKKLIFVLLLQNGVLTTIRANPGTRDVMEWKFEYLTIDGLLMMSRLQHPIGGHETLSYSPAALKLPSNAPVRALPAVSAHNVFPGADQPSIRREYSYSSNNYLGFGSSAPWRASGDNLYRLPGNYEYWTTETLVQGTGQNRRVVRSIKRIYNRFHLQVRETTQQNTKVIDKRTEYHGSAGVEFARQSPKFQLPRREQTDYYDTRAPRVKRTEVTVSEFDDFANLIRKVLPSGVTELYEFYPAQGADGCPADDFGRPRWLREKTVIPAGSAVDTPSLLSRFRYTQLPSSHSVRPHWIAVARESLYEGKNAQPFKVIETQYEENKTSPFLGKVIRRTETVQQAMSTLDYRYRLQDDVLRTDIWMTGHDRVNSARSIWQHALTGQEVKTLGLTGVVIEISYDRLGRTTSQVVEPGTPNEAAKTFEYQLPTTRGGASHIVMNDAAGAQTRTRFDGLNRELLIELQDLDSPGTPLRAVYAARYDGVGQLVEEVHTDWIKGKPHAVTTQHQYDDWGNRVSSMGADGVKRHDVQDPIEMTQTQWQEGAGRTITRKNLFGKPVSVERIDQKGIARGVTRYAYDGMGRCIEKTSPTGAVTRFTYDFADRLLTTLLPDGTQVKKAYVGHSTDDLATHIWVDGYLVGQREFDSLLRVTRLNVGGRSEVFTFDGAQARPASRTTPAGALLQFDYEPSLENQLTQRKVAGNQNLAARFHYDGTHGGLVQASDPGSQQQLHYSPSGKLLREELVEGRARFEVLHETSLNGLPLTYTDAGGQARVIRYDSFCRVSTLEQGELRVSFTYDALGRPQRMVTHDRQTLRSLVTTLFHDDFGREIRRVTSVEGGQTQELVQHFDDNDKLIRRTLSQDKQVLRDERFNYDPRGRLQRYSCIGPQTPVDARARAIVSQLYKFDALDNIRELATVFVGGQDIATYHYTNPDRTQLTRVTHSHPDYKALDTSFSYNKDGHLLNDEQGRGWVYDELGRLVEVKQSPAAAATSLIHYRYDPQDRLLGTDITGQASTTHFYQDERLVTRLQGDACDSYLLHDQHLLAQACRKGAKVEHILLGTDQQRSVLQTVTPEGQQAHAYTSYGLRPTSGGLGSLLGFNGELPDPVTGCYLLGSGYRAYNPVLMRFHSPDNLSPFGAGGINPYAYCLGDPINMSDPSGHFSWRAVLGIVIAVASIAITVVTLGTAAPATGPAAVGGLSLSTSAALINLASSAVGIAATVVQEVEPQSQAGAILGYVSLGLGILGGGFDKAAGRTATEASTTLVRQNAIRVSNGQPLKSISGLANLGAGARNTVQIEERIRIAQQVLGAFEQAVDGAEKIEDYVIPYLFPPQKDPNAPSQAQTSVLESVLRAGGKHIAKKAVVEAISQFLAPDLKRVEQIRRLI